MDLGGWLICSEFNSSVRNRVYECMPKMAECLDLYGYNPSNVFLFPKTKKNIECETDTQQLQQRPRGISDAMPPPHPVEFNVAEDINWGVS